MADFIVQFGIAAAPGESTKWDTVLPDDPMYVQPNIRGTISFATAGPHTRTTQLFINTHDNQDYLDRMGFTPIGIIVQTTPDDGDGDDDAMDTILPYIAKPKTKISEDGIDQDHYMKYGNHWLLQHYPEVDMILNTTLITTAELDEVDRDNEHHTNVDDIDPHVHSIGRISPPEENPDEHDPAPTHRFQNRHYNNDNP